MAERVGCYGAGDASGGCSDQLYVEIKNMAGARMEG
jgi:hypothetical protein